jgi:FAD/FMN-containing dehydrogenase
VLIASLAATAAGIAAGPVAATAGAAAGQTAKLPPPPPLDGELRFDEASRAAAADDFGHIVQRTPEGVLLPGSEQDVATIIRWAGGLGRKIAPQGQSHSVYGRAQVRAGIVIDMTQLRTVHDVQNDRVVVDAGAKWSEVLAVTLPQGLTPPVLTDYLELSVGGTTSQYGMQSDNVLELDVVTGTGEKVTCSPDRNADLFDAVRAGLGQVAVITRATLTLIPAPEHVRRYVLTYPDLRTLLTDERLLAADKRFDAVQRL